LSKNKFKMCKKFSCIALFVSIFSYSQNTINGKVTFNNEALAFATIYIKELNKGVETNEDGFYKSTNISNGSYTIIASFVGFKTEIKIYS